MSQTFTLLYVPGALPPGADPRARQHWVVGVWDNAPDARERLCSIVQANAASQSGSGSLSAALEAIRSGRVDRATVGPYTYVIVSDLELSADGAADAGGSVETEVV